MLFGLSGCVFMSLSTEERHQKAHIIAQRASLQHRYRHAGPFVFTTYSKMTNPNVSWHIYIEGDGLAWLSYIQPSPDPTPQNPVALRLAAQDLHPNVIYFARPCQYTPVDMNPVCATPEYWTRKRVAPEVITALSEAIDTLVAQTKGQSIALWGYSGGATLALFLAAERNDVSYITTIAGNVDPDAVSRYHQVSLLENTAAFKVLWPKIAQIPQTHWVGRHDTVVPPFITEKFVMQLRALSQYPQQIQMQYVDTSHGKWSEISFSKNIPFILP
jgi:hypothetical protein